MPNPSELEREACPDCRVLEKELTVLRERAATLEKELDSAQDERDDWINRACQHRERLDALEKELQEQARRWGNLAGGLGPVVLPRPAA